MHSTRTGVGSVRFTQLSLPITPVGTPALTRYRRLVVTGEQPHSRGFRGSLPVKDDTAVTNEDVKKYNLILFGDPGSNALIARVLSKLPFTWTEKELTFGKNRYTAAGHAPLLIQPNPLADGRYVVINSGHTFREKELASLNYLLFPRLGDWAVLKVGAKAPANPSDPLEEEVIRAGFFDARWLLP